MTSKVGSFGCKLLGNAFGKDFVSIFHHNMKCDIKLMAIVVQSMHHMSNRRHQLMGMGMVNMLISIMLLVIVMMPAAAFH